MRRTTTGTRKLQAKINHNADSDQGNGGQIDWSRLGPAYQAGVVQITLNGAVAADATSVTVDALPVALKKGDVLQSSADEYLTLTDDAAVGDTTLAVEAVTTAMEDNDVMYYVPNNSIGRFIPAFTVMCRTSDGKLIPRNVGSGSGTEVSGEILASDADELSKSDAKTGYGTYRGGGFYENLMPDAGTNGASAGDLPSTWKTELGARFWFEDWRDSSAE